MKKITYDLRELDYRIKYGSEETFQGIKGMMESLGNEEIYFHFVGHPDNLWNNIGMPDRARKEVVPIKKAKKIRTIGLYYPVEWAIQKFGGELAKQEKRDMSFLPENIEIPTRFYCYSNTVYYIFELNKDFHGLEIINKNYAKRHKELVEKIRRENIPNNGLEAELDVLYDVKEELFKRGISSFILLDLLEKGYSRIFIDDPIKGVLRDLLSKSKGIDLNAMGKTN